MKGHVATPPDLADRMVTKLFSNRQPKSEDRILYPGIGSNAPFINAVQDWCDEHDAPIPETVGVELDPDRIADTEKKTSKAWTLRSRSGIFSVQTSRETSASSTTSLGTHRTYPSHN